MARKPPGLEPESQSLLGYTAAHLANLAAGVVVAKLGTYAISAAELATALAEIQHPEEWEQ